MKALLSHSVLAVGAGSPCRAGGELVEVTVTPCVCPVPLLQTLSGLGEHLAEHSRERAF